MKITLLIRSLNRGGAERQVSVLAREIAARGHDICVAVFYPGAMDDELVASGVRIAYLGKRSRWDVLGFLQKVTAFVKDEQPDLIYSFLTVGNLISAALKLWRPSLKVVWGVRASAMDVRQYDLAIALSVKLERFLAFVPNGIISNSHAGLEALGVPKGQQSAVIANGIDLAAFTADPDARKALRREWGISDRELLIGLVARIDPMKDHETFLAAAAAMRKSRPYLRFVCIGDATTYDRDRLNKLARKYNIEDLLYFSSRPDVITVYAALDLLVLSSAFGEGSPNVIIEAAACGKPTVATDIGACAELVGDPSRLVPPRQPEALAQACLRLIDSPEFGSPKVAADLRERVGQLYSLDHLTDSTLQALTDMTVTASPSLASVKSDRPILMVIGSLKFGGAERHLLGIAPALQARGWKPVVYVLTGRGVLAKQMAESGIPILGGQSSSPFFRWLPRPLRVTVIFLDLIRVLLTLRPVACHCFLPQSVIIGGFASYLVGLRRVVMSRLSLNNYQADAPVQSWLEQLLMRHAGAVLGNAGAVTRQLREELIPERLLGVVYTGLDLPGLDDGPSREELRERENIPPDALVLSIVANLHAYKGHSYLLTALGGIKDKLPTGWILLCIGGDAGCLQDLTTQTEELGLSGHIRFLGGRSDAAHLWRTADIGLLVSLQEGFPMSILEGMATRLPMVVTNVGGNAEAVGDCGMIVPVGDTEAMGQAIMLYAQDPGLRRRHGETARHRVEAHFTLENCADAYDRIYHALYEGDLRPIQQIIDGKI